MPRSSNIILRVSPEEKALTEAAARTAGLTTSEFIRREAGIGKFRRADLMGLKRGPGGKAQRPQRADDFEERVRELSKSMPRRNAEVLARRERATA